jgi:ribosomal protein S18 acetylase RimI-like enzyme
LLRRPLRGIAARAGRYCGAVVALPETHHNAIVMPTLADFLAPMQARAPDAADAAFLAHLYASTRPDLASATATPAAVSALMAMQQRLQAADYRQAFPTAQYVLIESAGQRVARVVLSQAEAELRLIDIAVCETLRGQGIGTHLLRALQHYAGAQSLRLTLSVHHSNPAARRLYCRLGFQIASSGAFTDQLVWNNAGQLIGAASTAPSPALPFPLSDV